MASSPAPNGAASDGYLPSDWIVPPNDWPPSHLNHSSKRPRSRPPRPRPTRSASASDSAPDRPDGAAGDDIEESDDEADETFSEWSSSSWDSELAAREAQLQWDESMRQLQALLNLVAIPWISRYFGRKWAYSLFDRYLHVGLGKRFWLGPLAVYAPRTWR